MPNPASLQAVAKAARVSAMTVSRVLHGSTRVAPATRRAVQKVLLRLGYKPDPHIARLMARVRSHRQRQAGAVIAVVRDDVLKNDLYDPAYQYVSLGDIQRRAARHGYLAEEFILGSRGVTPSRMNSVLRARGVEGLIISPQSSRGIGSQLDYSPFAAVTFGYGLATPALHRASTNMTQGILDAAEQLRHRGYRRISIAITPWIDARANHTYSGAMLHWQQQIPPRDRIPPLFFPENNPATGEDAFCAWAKKHRPDGIISFHLYVPDWLTKRLGLHIPDDVGLVAHDWTDQMQGLAGIYHRRPFVAAAGVDLIATQLMQNERGIPEVPHQVLVPPAWIEGPSIRPPHDDS